MSAETQLKRTIQKLGRLEKELAELEQSAGLPTDVNLSWDERVARLRQRAVPPGNQ
jgi:hypothetical protein